MDKSQKVASSVIFLIVCQILIELISQGIHIKIRVSWFNRTNKSITKSFLLPGTNKKLDLHLLILFNLIIFVHPKVQQTEHSSKHQVSEHRNAFTITKMAIITYI